MVDLQYTVISGLFPPYMDEMSNQEKLEALIEELSRAIQLKNQTSTHLCIFLRKVFQRFKNGDEKGHLLF